MIKKIIFDVDNTLIPWKKEYFEEIKEVLNELKIDYTENDFNQILKALGEYENEHYKFDRKLMIEYINKCTGKQYPIEFMYGCTDKWSKCAPEKIELQLIETLEYLKTKYELVVLTDWYADQQAKRLEKAGILKYFTNVYGAEKTNRKPFKDAFIQAIGDNMPEECVMIGDSLERDIKGALNVGCKAINYSQDNNISEEYITISKLEKLREIL